MALLDEVADWESVLVGVSRCETLVCHVEESIMLARLDGLADLLPLLDGWVNARRVMRAGVKEEDASLGSTFNVRDHAFEIKPDCVLVVVSVLLDFQTRILEHGGVVCP